MTPHQHPNIALNTSIPQSGGPFPGRPASLFVRGSLRGLLTLQLQLPSPPTILETLAHRLPLGKPSDSLFVAHHNCPYMQVLWGFTVGPPVLRAGLTCSGTETHVLS